MSRSGGRLFEARPSLLKNKLILYGFVSSILYPAIPSISHFTKLTSHVLWGILPAVQGTAVSVRWITNRNFDLLWYVAACLTGYLLIYLNIGLGIPALLLVWFWIVSVDGPHVFGTLSRTYLDREEWKSRRRLFLGSLLWFLVGPLFLAISLLIHRPGPFFTFLVLAQLWAYWHVVRQHYGFMVLYQKKNGEAAGKQNPADYWIFYTLMLAPFLSFLLRHPQAREQLGLPGMLTVYEQYVVVFLNIVVAGTLLAYAVKELTLARKGNPINVPKNLFLLACVPLHLLIFLHPYISTRVDVRLFAVFVTFYHNIQYHGIVWFYNRNRYGNPEKRSLFGPAGAVSRNFLTYYACGILFTLLYRYPNWFFVGAAVPLAPGPNIVSGMGLGGLFHVSDLAIGFWWGFAFNHYYLDQKIWRLSKDKQLNQDLKLAVQPQGGG